MRWYNSDKDRLAARIAKEVYDKQKLEWAQQAQKEKEMNEEPCNCGAEDCPVCFPEQKRDKSGEVDDLSLDDFFDGRS